MQHKTVGNQIHDHGLGVYAMKIESTVVEMFQIAKMAHSRPNNEEKIRVKRIISLRLRNQ